jgi:hypothetical protein
MVISAIAQNKLSVTQLDDFLKEGLSGLFDDLCRFDWYVREHEIVNLFVFSQLVPLFQKHDIDLTTIGIEFPAMQVPLSERSRFGARKDLVIWPEGRTTLWKGCDLSKVTEWQQLHEPGRKPLAIIEWKNISRITAHPTVARAEHKMDIEWLKRNLRGGMMTVGYAVLVDQST